MDLFDSKCPTASSGDLNATDSFSLPDRGQLLAIGVFNSIMSPLTFVGNGLFVAAWVKDPLKLFRTPASGLLLVMCAVLAVEMFKVYNNLAPPCLLEKFTKLQNAYNLRGSSTKLSLPLPKTNYGKRRFSYKGAYLWNRLPEDMRNSESLNIFKNKLKRLPPCFFDSL